MNRQSSAVQKACRGLVNWCACVVRVTIFLAGCGTTPAPPAAPQVSPAPSFKLTDVTPASGVAFTYRNGKEAGILSIVESLGGGVGMLDYDGDGWFDLLFPGGGTFGPGENLAGRPLGLFRQIAPFTFQEVTGLADADSARHFSHGCTVGDYDNDGFSDILITGYGGLQLWHNQGDGTFVEAQDAAGLHDSKWSSSAGWGDLNGDGFLDLYVAHYVDWSWQNHPPCGQPERRDVCPPRSFRGLDHILYLANGDGTFRDASRDAGLVPEGKGLGVLVVDVDVDGDLDIYVANDTVDNFLYLNDGRATFAERGIVSGVAVDDRGVANGSMGLAVLDFNRDQLPDLWVTNFENESSALYRNDGSAAFTHVSQGTGIFALGSTFVGFGTAAGDMDRDGDEDLVVTNGHVIYYPQSGHVAQVPLLLRNEQSRFERVDFAADDYFGKPHHGRGLALGDLDNDGDLDCAFSNNNEPAAIVRNDTLSDGGWLGVRLIGRHSNRDGIGARAVLHTTEGDQLRMIAGGGSYLSQNDLRLFWGLSKSARPAGLTIHWPGGGTQSLKFEECNRYIQVIEP